MHRFRVLACLVVMVAMLVAGLVARLRPPVMPPHGPWVPWCTEADRIRPGPARLVWVRPNPFVVLYQQLTWDTPAETVSVQEAHVMYRRNDEYGWYR